VSLDVTEDCPTADLWQFLLVVLPEGLDVRALLIRPIDFPLHDDVRGRQGPGDPLEQILIEIGLFADPVHVHHIGRAIAVVSLLLDTPPEHHAGDGPRPVAAEGRADGRLADLAEVGYGAGILLLDKAVDGRWQVFLVHAGGYWVPGWRRRAGP
jgi:hypothetical protein